MNRTFPDEADLFNNRPFLHHRKICQKVQLIAAAKRLSHMSIIYQKPGDYGRTNGPNYPRPFVRSSIHDLLLHPAAPWSASRLPGKQKLPYERVAGIRESASMRIAEMCPL